MPTDKRLRQKEREQAARAARAAEMAQAKRRRNIILAAVGLVAVFAFAFLYSTIRGGDEETTVTPGAETDEPTETTLGGETVEPGDDDAAPEPGSAECPPEDGVDEPVLDFDGPPQFCLEEGATYQAVFETDAGDITVDLDTENTPNTVNNFVFLARYGYYDGTEMFRSNTGIDIIQGGSPHTQDNADPGPGYTIQDEGGPYSYSTGDLVMARTAAPNSASAQYFFSTGPDTQLLNDQGTYVVFGSVVDGLDVLEAIMATHVDGGGGPGEGAPDPKPVVTTVRIIQS
jgi:cyclophilin family peptidyl-prolyl cis-trans isomerase